MRTAVPLVVGLLLLAACSSVRPVAIKSGDICEGCRRAIDNPKIAAEIVNPSGVAMKFRRVSCMAKYLNDHTDKPAGIFVTDYRSGTFIPAQSAMFVRAQVDENTRELDYYAFEDVQPAVDFSKEHGASPVDWLSVMKRIAASSTN